MSEKVYNKLFFLISFLLVFVNIPNLIRINIIGSTMADKLTFYPLLISFIYVFYCQYRNENRLPNFRRFKIFIIGYIILLMVSLLIGLYSYSYYEQILNGPLDQVEKLTRIVKFLQNYNININEQISLILWIIIKTIKNLFLEIIYTFGGAYIIYCWYYRDFNNGFNILLKAILSAIIIILLYSIVEVFYLAGNNIAREILIIITPFIHIINTNHGWWPPLLWDNQLRSIFSEPSVFGMYAAFAMPFLWYKMMKVIRYKKMYSLLLLLFTFCLFLTQARTAIALFSGELVLLIISVLYLKNKILLKKIIIILCCTIISFISANVFITNIMVENKQSSINTSVEMYLEDNLGSLASTKERSNNARYSTMIADLKIGLDNPILGVGTGLRNAYIPEYLPEMSIGNNEINKWIIDQKEQGILKASIPKLGEYTSRFAETGILGLIVFLMPPIFLLINLLKKIRKEKDLRYVLFTISFIGMLATGIGDSINITYCYWVLLGIGYAMCFGKPGDGIKYE